MPRFRRLLALVRASSRRRTADRLTPSLTALFATIALITVVTSGAEAQGRAADDTPLHVPTSHFDFVASGDRQLSTKPLAVHNGGAARLTDVRLTRISYGEPAHGVGWLVALPRQSAVAPDELATVGTLCVDAAGLAAGTYRATAAVSAREVAEPVPITITLVVTEASARARRTAARCGPAITK